MKLDDQWIGMNFVYRDVAGAFIHFTEFNN